MKMRSVYLRVCNLLMKKENEIMLTLEKFKGQVVEKTIVY